MSTRRGSVPYQASEKSYLLSDISRINCPLPLPCIVEDGFYGASAWDTVSSGEIIFLNTLEKRSRALASDGHVHYSIPLDYPLKFSVISKGNESLVPPKTIEEIVNHCKLPITLKVDQKNTTLHLASNLRRILHLGNLTVTQTYDEKYFTGHAVIRKELQHEIIMLPTFLKVRVRIIDGIAGFSTAQWNTVLETWKTALRQTSLNLIRPPIDIIMFSSIPQKADCRPSKTTQQTSEDIYETLEPTTYVKLNFNLVQRRSNVYTTLSAVKQSTTDEAAEGATARNQAIEAVKTPDAQASIRKSDQGLHKELQQTLSNRGSSESHRPAPPPKLCKTLSEDLSRKRVPTPPRISPDEPSLMQPPPSQVQLQPVPVPRNRPPLASESPPDQPAPSYLPDEEIDADYQIQPRSRSSNIRSLKDIPASVDKLNSEEVADCLRLLKMAKYIDNFLINQVDGLLLSELDEDILTRDLQMTPLHAKKLVLFAQKGWRPFQGPSEGH